MSSPAYSANFWRFLGSVSGGEGLRVKATLFMALLTAFSLLLGRYCGQDEVTVGSPVAGRTRSELEGLIGFFVNTIVLRCDLRGEPTFRELLARVRQTAVRAYAHQDLPFEKLVEDLQPKRDLSRNPLHQVMLQVQKTRFAPAPGASVPEEKETSVFDLSLDLWDGPGGLRGKLEYSSDLFDRTSVERMVRHFEVLLEGLVARPDATVRQVSLMSAREQAELEAFNATAAPVPNQCIHELINAQSIRTLGAPAVGTLTYRELMVAANGVARRLISSGAGPETLIGVSMSHGPALVIALLRDTKGRRRLFTTRPARSKNPQRPDHRRGFPFDRLNRYRHIPALCRDSLDSPRRPGFPRLRDLHLRLDRQPESRPR
jgi:non-ribosomal peptide synthetase component F